MQNGENRDNYGGFPGEYREAREETTIPGGVPDEVLDEVPGEPEAYEEVLVPEIENETQIPVKDLIGPRKDNYTIGEVVERLKPDFPSLSVSKIRYLERRRLINLTRTRGGYRLFSDQDVELLRYILTLQEEEYLPLKVIKKRIEGGAPVLTSGAEATNELSRVLEDRTYTREELAEALEADSRFVEDLISVGVIGRNGSLTQRDAEIARMALEMAKYSIQPRHLRGIMAAVEREAAMFKQILNPELRSGDELRTAEAVEKARHLAAVDSRLKELMMSNVIDSFVP